MSFDIEKWLRPNILRLKPYSSARDEFSGNALVFLDANESPFKTGLNRYPDPQQRDLKQSVASLYQVRPDQVFLGNGSDEAIDLLVRVSCSPGSDRILSISPSYGMYQVSANIQGVEQDFVLLNNDFSLNADSTLSAANETHKLLFLCSPNNPTGNLLDQGEIEAILVGFHGVVVVDEAYIDFSDTEGLLHLIDRYENLIVLRTFSKAWGLAGARCGMAFGNSSIIAAMSKIKYPYNLNVLTQMTILDAIRNKDKVDQEVSVIRNERKRLKEELSRMEGIIEVYPSEANFLLIKVENPQGLYQNLVSKGIIVRDRSKENLCGGCLRITVGLPEENDVLIETLKVMTT